MADETNMNKQQLIADAEIIKNETGRKKNTQFRIGSMFENIINSAWNLFVPNTRKINKKPLTNDIDLNVTDIGAAPEKTTLTDATASNTLPSTSSSTIISLLQVIRNCLKWLTAKFDSDGKLPYSNIKDTPISLKNPKPLNFTGAEFDSYDGSSEKTIKIPKSLPADGGNADTIGGIGLSTPQHYKENTIPILGEHGEFEGTAWKAFDSDYSSEARYADKAADTDTVGGIGKSSLVYYKGILPAGNTNTKEYWLNIEAGVYFSNAWGSVLNKPTDYAVVEVIKAENEVSILWHTQSGGTIYRASTNGSLWSPFKALAFISDIPSSIPANGGNADTVGGFKVSRQTYQPDTIPVLDEHGEFAGHAWSAEDSYYSVYANNADLAEVAKALQNNSLTTAMVKDKAIQNAKLADMAANTIKARTGSAGQPQDLSISQVKSMLGITAVPTFQSNLYPRGVNTYFEPGNIVFSIISRGGTLPAILMNTNWAGEDLFIPSINGNYAIYRLQMTDVLVGSSFGGTAVGIMTCLDCYDPLNDSDWVKAPFVAQLSRSGGYLWLYLSPILPESPTLSYNRGGSFFSGNMVIQ